MIEKPGYVLMPEKADAEMGDAIEAYFRGLFKHRKNPDSDAMKADCWMALMAYYAMVKVVKERKA